MCVENRRSEPPFNLSLLATARACTHLGLNKVSNPPGVAADFLLHAQPIFGNSDQADLPIFFSLSFFSSSKDIFVLCEQIILVNRLRYNTI